MRAARAWRALARLVGWLNGDAAYARYLEHWRTHHAGEGGLPLDRAAFHRAELERRWNGVRRCC